MIFRIYGFDMMENDLLFQSSENYDTKQKIFSLIQKEWANIYDKEKTFDLTQSEIKSAQEVYEKDTEFYPDLDSAIAQVSYWKEIEYKNKSFENLLENLISEYGFKKIDADFFIDIDKI